MGIRDILCLETQGVFVLPATWIYFSADVKIVGCYFLPSPLFFFRLSVCLSVNGLIISHAWLVLNNTNFSVSLSVRTSLFAA